MSQSHPKAKPPISTGILTLATWLFLAIAGILVAVQFRPEAVNSLLATAGFSSLLGSVRGVEVFDSLRSITYIGSAKGQVEHFQNIFYAEDTSGRNRFAPPKPFLPPPGSQIDATKSGAWCPQGTGNILPWTSPVHNISENCLSLRIARPADTEFTSKLPVIVFVHGGGHALGSASDVLYTPDGFIEQSIAQGLPTLYVGINYRMGFLGYAYTNALQELKHTNLGMRDQLAAFEWIRKHIATFGGDPDRITALGHSVGASDLGLHLTSFGGGSKGVPFHRLILLSGPPSVNVNTKSIDQVKQRTHDVADKLGCKGDPEVDSARITRCLREVPLESLTNVSITAMRMASPPFGEAYFYPILDNDIITDYASDLMRRGNYVKGVPLLVSWAHDDAAWFPAPTTASDEEVLASFAFMLNGLSNASRKKLLELYPASDFEDRVPAGTGISPQYFRASRLVRDLLFNCGILDFTWQYAKHGGSDVRIWTLNQTRYAPAYERMGAPFWGVGHLSDLPYVFNIHDLPGGIDSSPAQLSLAREISGTIVAFVNERPGEKSSEHFPPSWTAAYAGSNMKDEHPPAINLKMFGGPEGSGIASISRTEEPQGARAEFIVRQKLFERCDFLNSPRLREERGV